MKAKILREFKHKDHHILIQGVYGDQAPYWATVKHGDTKKTYRDVVYLQSILTNPDGSLVDMVLQSDIERYDLDHRMAYFTVKKTGKWYNRKKELVHIKDNLELKLNELEKDLRASVDSRVKSAERKQYFQEITDGLPDSLDDL